MGMDGGGVDGDDELDSVLAQVDAIAKQCGALAEHVATLRGGRRRGRGGDGGRRRGDGPTASAADGPTASAAVQAAAALPGSERRSAASRAAHGRSVWPWPKTPCAKCFPGNEGAGEAPTHKAGLLGATLCSSTAREMSRRRAAGKER